MQQRFVLRGEHHEHEDERQGEREVQRASAFLEFTRFTGELDACFPPAALRRPLALSESSASPSVKPGAMLADSVNDRTRLK